jgi:hypothetical protein
MIHGARKEVDHGRRDRGAVLASAPYHLLAACPSRKTPTRTPSPRLDEAFLATLELFPPGFARGYELKDDRTSAKQGTPIRRIRLRDGAA